MNRDDGRVVLAIAMRENVESVQVTMTADEAREIAAMLTKRAEGVERERR